MLKWKTRRREFKLPDIEVVVLFTGGRPEEHKIKGGLSK